MPVAVLSALSLGMAVDFAIHFLERARTSYAETGSWQKSAGEMFGEFALIDSLPRSMSAVCVEDATVLVIAKHDFERLMAQHTELGSRIYRNIAETLVGRLRRKLEPDPKKPRYIHTIPGVGYHMSTS